MILRSHSTGCRTTRRCGRRWAVPRASASSMNSEPDKWRRERSSSTGPWFQGRIAAAFGLMRHPSAIIPTTNMQSLNQSDSAFRHRPALLRITYI